MAKKEKKQKKSKGRWELYDGVKRKNKSCPKCGSGTFMAQHKDRHTCGKCGYMEKKEAVVNEEKPSEKKTDKKK